MPVVQNSPTPVFLAGIDNHADGRHGEGSVRAASTLSGMALSFATARGLNNGLFETFSINAEGLYDDIVISGPVAGADVPFTLRLPIHVNFAQSYSAISFEGFLEAATPANDADFRATLFTPGGPVQGRFELRSLIDENDTVDFLLTGNVLPTGDPGPMSSETGPTGITIFHNIPLGAGDFFNLATRTQIPITSASVLYGPGAGLADEDIVELRAELLLSGGS